ncbi:uncharacterized protein LOC106052490 [Biomphalaria glabrata]|uniref:Uncharacterized protein LOC106052490 n=1 Tax=Biomphalaria glabrata TaxID=6526 RepID=A0A2C9M8R5_BIOGL|nr:uncharacterized protein LOC106052490 [Biomphalaria glabrata]KAI8797593.1 THUMP domain-containing protein 1 [Biomphalaria glabrata]
MPLELCEIDPRRQVLGPGDKGFLISLTKSKWSKPAGAEIIKVFKMFAPKYYEYKCPEEAKNKKSSNDKDNCCGIQFIQRELVYNNCGFVASNLEDPAEFAHFVFAKISEQRFDAYKTSKAIRVMPVEAVCEAKARAVEAAILPSVLKKLGQTQDALRFSLIFRGHSTVNSLPQPEAKAVIRNCIWSVNPNCVQCIKYQDYAVLMHMLPPVFLVGVCKDFQRLGGYNTWTARQGPDLTDLGEDSEDEISDDPELEEDDEKKRKLRIKRKRRAEKAGLKTLESSLKKSTEKTEQEEEHNDDDHDEDDQDHYEEHIDGNLKEENWDEPQDNDHSQH